MADPPPEIQRQGEGPEFTPLLEETGTPKDYLNYIATNEDFALTDILKQVREAGLRPRFEDYAREWEIDPHKHLEGMKRLFPKGPGYNKFFEGLSQTPFIDPERKIINKDFEESFNVLKEIINRLRERDKKYHEAVELREKLVRKEGAVTENIKSGVSSFIESFKKGSATEKITQLAALGLVIYALNWLKDKKLPFVKKEDWKWGKLMGLGAVGWAINKITGKLSKDGKTFLQRVDLFGNPLENVRGSVWAAFALDGKEDGQRLETPQEHEVMYAFGTKDIRSVEEIYRRYLVENRETFTESDLLDMGFEVDEARKVLGQKGEGGKIAFKVVDKLFRRAGKNYFTALRLKKLAEIKPLPADAAKAMQEKDFGELGLFAIREKYLEPESPLSSQKWTFEEVIVEEMRALGEMSGGWDKLMEKLEKDAKADSIPGRMKKGGGEFLDRGRDLAIESLNWSGKKLGILGGWVATKFRKGFDIADAKYKEMMDEQIDDEIRLKVLESPKHKVTVKVTGYGKVKIMDYPTTYTRKKTGKDSSGNDVYTYVIEGVTVEPNSPFTPDKSQEQLAKKITEKVREAAKQGPLKGKERINFDKLEYEHSTKVWFVDGPEALGSREFNIPDKQTAILVIFNKQGRLEYHVEHQFSAPLEDLDTLDEQYQKAVLVKRIRDQNKFLDRIGITIPAYLKMPVRIWKIEKQHGRMVAQGDIGGSEFLARHSGTDTVEFIKVDSAGGVIDRGLSAVSLSDQFIQTKVNQVAEDLVYHQVFERLINTVDATNILTKEQKNAWRYLIEFKRGETLDFLEGTLKKGKDLSDVKAAQDRYIADTLRDFENWTNAYEALLEDDPTGPNDRKREFARALADFETKNYQHSNPLYRGIYGNLMTQVMRYELGSIVSPYFGEGDKNEALNIIRNYWSYHTREIALKPSFDFVRGVDNITLERVRGEIVDKLNAAKLEGLPEERITASELKKLLALP